jgi:hypothetical protein
MRGCKRLKNTNSVSGKLGERQLDPSETFASGYFRVPYPRITGDSRRWSDFLHGNRPLIWRGQSTDRVSVDVDVDPVVDPHGGPIKDWT